MPPATGRTRVSTIVPAWFLLPGLGAFLTSLAFYVQYQRDYPASGLDLGIYRQGAQAFLDGLPVYDLRFTLDNPCGFHLRVEARESPQRVLTLQPIGAWPGHGTYICPGLLNLETYTAKLTGLRAGEWRVRADTLTQFPVPGFVIR